MSRRRAAIDYSAGMADVHNAVRHLRRASASSSSSSGEYLDEPAAEPSAVDAGPAPKRPKRPRKTRDEAEAAAAAASPDGATQATATHQPIAAALPVDVLARIFKKLPAHMLVQVSRVCRQWRCAARVRRPALVSRLNLCLWLRCFILRAPAVLRCAALPRCPLSTVTPEARTRVHLKRSPVPRPTQAPALYISVDISHLTLSHSKTAMTEAAEARQRTRLRRVLGPSTLELAMHDSLATPSFLRFVQRRCKNLQRLYIAVTCLSVFDAPTLQGRSQLCAMPVVPFENTTTQPSGVVLDPWPCLTELHINSFRHGLRWAGPPLPNLKTVVFYDIYSAPCMTLEALAFLVNRCTSLEHLTIGCRVYLQDLALIFAMLRKLRTLTHADVVLQLRNFQYGDGLTGVRALLQRFKLETRADVANVLAVLMEAYQLRRAQARQARQDDAPQVPAAAGGADLDALLSRLGAFSVPPNLVSYEYAQHGNTESPGESFSSRLMDHVVHSAHERLRQVYYTGALPRALDLRHLTHLHLAIASCERLVWFPPALESLSLEVEHPRPEEIAPVYRLLEKLDALRAFKLATTVPGLDVPEKCSAPPLPTLGRGRLVSLCLAFPMSTEAMLRSLDNTTCSLRRLTLVVPMHKNGQLVARKIGERLAHQLESLTLFGCGPTWPSACELLANDFPRLRKLSISGMRWDWDWDARQDRNVTALASALARFPRLEHCCLLEPPFLGRGGADWGKLVAATSSTVLRRHQFEHLGNFFCL